MNLRDIMCGGSRMLRISLIPAYRPDDRLINLVDDLIENDFKVIVVNDGSGSEYDDIFDKIRDKVLVLSYDINRGKGYALKYGMKHILKHYKNYILVTMDCDGQHTVKDAIKLCDYIKEHDDELVIGKRVRSKKTPIRSRIGNVITMMIYNLITGISIYDTQTGLRCFSNKLMDLIININGDRYEYEMNMLLQLPDNNIKITEIEIETIYFNNNNKSHFQTLKDSFRIYKQIIKFSLSSIISFIIDYILYTLFVLIFNNISLANIIARLISASFNYTVNRNIVFESKRKIKHSLIEYSILAIFILIVNTLLLNLLVFIGINLFIAKILVEICLFFVSWFVQKNRVFKKK